MIKYIIDKKTFDFRTIYYINNDICWKNIQWYFTTLQQDSKKIVTLVLFYLYNETISLIRVERYITFWKGYLKWKKVSKGDKLNELKTEFSIIRNTFIEYFSLYLWVYN